MKGLQFLHKKLQIVHRDLKLDNILMQIPLPKTKIYICDFGIAKQLEKSRTNTCVGTVEYSAPEVFRANEKGQSDSPYNFKCDTWSLGIITHIVLSGISPFYSDRKEVILKNARDGRLDFQRKQFSKISTYAKDFVAALLNIDVGCRLDIDECFEHCWIKSNRAKLEKFYREKIENIL
ncbi:uncharacterized protein LODBEIA_P37070 [Lodderomyces beijingensis]|uniref:Protein kinase domain-containing protein n=1 Tax=Lodderomyces beijingensis TaxID=1775926 RepID=A0ABP0ZP84_9ASCO